MKKILIADDMPNVFGDVKRSLLQHYADAEFIFVHIFGIEDLEKLKEHILRDPPDLLITDQNFFDGRTHPKGTDIIRWIREEQGMNFPIVLFTGNPQAAKPLLKTEWKVLIICSLSGLENAAKHFLQ